MRELSKGKQEYELTPEQVSSISRRYRIIDWHDYHRELVRRDLSIYVRRILSELAGDDEKLAELDLDAGKIYTEKTEKVEESEEGGQ